MKNFFNSKCSIANALTILIPDTVSLKVDIISPILSCIRVPLFLSFFPVLAIRRMDNGTSKTERIASRQLAHITIPVYIIARVVSLSISMKPLDTDSLIISTSFVIMDERLPVLLLLKKPSESVWICL